MPWIKTAILGLILVHALVKTLVDFLNFKTLGQPLPNEAEGIYDQDRYKKQQDYMRENTRLSLLRRTLQTVIVLLFLINDGLPFLEKFTLASSANSTIQAWVFFGTLGVASWLFGLPFSIYHTFGIEKRYGFNRTSWQTYVGDQIKAGILSAVIGGLLIAALVWFFSSFPTWGWLWAWVGMTLFQLLLVFLAPTVLMPLFNRFSPLPEGELKDAIEALAKKEAFALNGLFQMDGSKRSSKANAFFTGFGQSRRIVLFDTLIEKHPVRELVGILAHEIGHYKRGHIRKQMIYSTLTSSLVFFLFGKSLTWTPLFAAFGIANSVHMGMALFGLCFSPLSKALSLYSLHLSRKYEFEADAYARQATGDADGLIEGLKRLSSDSLSHLTPHPLKVWSSYTHPPVLERVAALRN